MGPRKGSRVGSKAQLLSYLSKNVGKVVNKTDLQAAANGASEWARRLRELRDEEGYDILSDKDREDLKPGEYVLVSLKRRPVFRRAVSKKVRALVLDRNGYTCQSCGLGPQDRDPYRPDRTIRLVIGHTVDKVKGGKDDPSNLKALCSNCNEGLQNRGISRPDLKSLVTQVRRATTEDQLFLLDQLLKKFPSKKL